MPISEAVLGRELDRLTGHFRPGEPKDRFTGWMREYDTAFAQSARTSDAIWQEAVTEAIRHFAKLPLVGEMRQVVEAVRADFVREDVPALPPPFRKADGIEPSDPHSCTPEERERWAREDAELRSYAARITAPEGLERLSAVDRASALDAHERNVSVANWVNLTPAARRAKEQRIAGEKAMVPQWTAQARVATRARLDAITAARAAESHLKQAGGQHTVNVQWKDGQKSTVTLASEDSALQAQRWVKQHFPDEADVPAEGSWPRSEA